MLETKLPEQWVKPYGDTLGDGRVQLSFTLPVALSETSKEGAKRLAALMGLSEPAVVHCEDMGQGFSFYVLYGQCRHQVDLSSFTVVKPDYEVMDKEAINALIAEKMGRRMVVYMRRTNPASPAQSVSSRSGICARWMPKSNGSGSQRYPHRNRSSCSS